ncbi:MAG: AI-2E family transporter [Nocardioides sp.]
MSHAVRQGRVTRDAAARAHRVEESSLLRVGLRHPFSLGFFATTGALLAWWLGTLILSISSLLVLVVVAMFLAAGLDPMVGFLGGKGLKRAYAVLVVILAVLAVLALFLVAFVPVIADQVTAIVDNAPGWLESLRGNSFVKDMDERFDVVAKAQEYIASGSFGQQVFGGVVGVGVAVLSALGNAFIIIVLTLYFLASLPKVKRAAYQLAPASKRPRVSELGDRIVKNIGAYVSGAFVVAVFAGVSSLIFLFVVGLGEYAVALAAVVALLDVIPMIGATVGAVIVTAIGFATDPRIGLACAIFYLVYQQVENYVIYPRVMSRSVNIPGSVIVIAALVGAGLLGVVGALLAIPTAAALLLILREVVVPRLDTH